MRVLASATQAMFVGADERPLPTLVTDVDFLRLRLIKSVGRHMGLFAQVPECNVLVDCGLYS